MEIEWFKTIFPTIASGFLGAFIVKIFDIIYTEYKSCRISSLSAKQVVNKHIDPILKSADQLLGQIISLSKKDFMPLWKKEPESSAPQNLEIMYSSYLFANFWAHLQLLQIESIHVNLTDDEKGKLLLDFISALGARKNRILSRAQQQLIGETIIENSGAVERKTFKKYLEDYSKNESYIAPLITILSETKVKQIRQFFLSYGVILHALVDSLDPHHSYIRERESYPNKLSQKTKMDIKHRVFETYLPKIKKSEKYWKV